MQKLSATVNKEMPNQATKRLFHNYYGGCPRKGDNKKYWKYFFLKASCIAARNIKQCLHFGKQLNSSSKS